MNCCSGDLIETQFSILDYCLSSVSKFYLPSVALTAYFKVVLTVVLSDYVIRYWILNPPCMS